MTSTSGPPTPAAEATGGQERHAGWNELFFDLVAVAGVGRLAHLLHTSPSWSDVGLYALLYLAFWTTWAGFAVYGDIAAASTRTRTLLLAMLGMAVMAAAVQGAHSQGGHSSHTTAFVLAYVCLRWYAGRIWRRGSVVTDWPLAQVGAGSVPWLVSLFVDAPWKYGLWALGLACDLVILLVSTRDRTLQHARTRQARLATHRPHGGRQAHGEQPQLSEARTDPAHLSERLGLYVILVLGEGVLQVIDATSENDRWDLSLAATALGALAMLAALWELSLPYGSYGIPQLRESTLPVRFTMLLHALVTAAMAALAAALGIAVAHPGAHLPAADRWLLCGAATAYFSLGVAASLAAGVHRTWLAGWAAPCVLLPAVLGVFGAGLPTWSLVWLLTALVCWQILYHPGPPTPAVAWRRPRYAWGRRPGGSGQRPRVQGRRPWGGRANRSDRSWSRRQDRVAAPDGRSSLYVALVSIRMRLAVLALPLVLAVPDPVFGQVSATALRPLSAEAAAPPPAPTLGAVVSTVPAAKLRHTLRAGCPVPARDLRLIRMNHWGFDGRVHRGELIVRKGVVQDVTQVFGKLFAARFPIRKMRVMADYRGNDEAAMADDNTSAFNCRQVTGDPSTLSRHSYGDALDINTVENPYVDAYGKVHPAGGQKYLRRDRPVKGMIRRGDVVTTAMARAGWLWGGRWPHPDYQHFSANGQ